eukprot:m.170937 g.170937  ORF g.170937 m.170937 type:complete len:143 (+) comp14541_c0_seq2:678-1106(+)
MASSHVNSRLKPKSNHLWQNPTSCRFSSTKRAYRSGSRDPSKRASVSNQANRDGQVIDHTMTMTRLTIISTEIITMTTIWIMTAIVEASGSSSIKSTGSNTNTKEPEVPTYERVASFPRQCILSGLFQCTLKSTNRHPPHRP